MTEILDNSSPSKKPEIRFTHYFAHAVSVPDPEEGESYDSFECSLYREGNDHCITLSYGERTSIFMTRYGLMLNSQDLNFEESRMAGKYTLLAYRARFDRIKQEFEEEVRQSKGPIPYEEVNEDDEVEEFKPCEDENPV